MTEYADTSLHDFVIHTFATLQAKDLESLMHMYAEDAVVIDPTFRRRGCKGKRRSGRAFGKR
jgi:ketosteroid isomerase-like protein